MKTTRQYRIWTEWPQVAKPQITGLCPSINFFFTFHAGKVPKIYLFSKIFWAFSPKCFRNTRSYLSSGNFPNSQSLPARYVCLVSWKWRFFRKLFPHLGRNDARFFSQFSHPTYLILMLNLACLSNSLWKFFQNNFSFLDFFFVLTWLGPASESLFPDNIMTFEALSKIFSQRSFHGFSASEKKQRFIALVWNNYAQSTVLKSIILGNNKF